MKVAILGASDKPNRYAHRAMLRLEAHGHQTFLVNPNLDEVEGRPVYKDLASIPEKIHTIAMYVNSAISTSLEKDIKDLQAKRIIFNPGSENRSLYPSLSESGTNVEEACVLVLLNTDQF